MISLQTLAVLTPVMALIMVSGYGWFEHRRIEQARKAEERELASASDKAASNYFDGDKPASESAWTTMLSDAAASNFGSNRRVGDVAVYLQHASRNYEDAARAWRRVELRSSDVKPSTPESAENLLAEIQRITVQLQGVLVSRSTAKP